MTLRLPLLSAAALLIFGAGALSACDDDAAPTYATARLALTADDGAGTAPLRGPDARGRDVEVAAARAYVGHVDLHLPDGAKCADLGLPGGQGGEDYGVHCDGDKIRYNGPWVVDLVAGTSSPALTLRDLPALNYKRVDVRFEEAKADDGLISEADPLAGSTLVASATLAVDGAATAADLALAFTEDARFEHPAGVSVGSGGELLLWLDVTGWFADLPLSECAADGDLASDGDRVLLHDGKGSCSGVEGALKEAIKRSGQLDRR